MGPVSDSPSVLLGKAVPPIKVQSMGLQPVTAGALPECLFQLFHVQRRKLSPGNKLPRITESRAWQGPSGSGIWPSCHSPCCGPNKGRTGQGNAHSLLSRKAVCQAC